MKTLLTAVVSQVFREGIDGNGAFDSIGSNGNWWSSTDANTSYAWYRVLFYITACKQTQLNKPFGFSVRCLKD
jgi:uncharacterized protein (TIGR02145 family)